MRERAPARLPGRCAAYAAWSGSSALVVLLELHRPLGRAARALSVPEPAISALMGVANVSWYELGYLVGGGLKSAAVFTCIPVIAAVAGATGAAAVLARARWRRLAVAAHLALGVLVAAAALGVLLWRWVRHFHDPWRLVTTVTLLLTHLAWMAYLGRMRLGAASVPARPPRPPRSP